MTEYFNFDGHLTDHALQSLISGEPDELERLEFAEHLAFCDICTEHYTAMLCDDCLLEPLEPLKNGVLLRVRQRAQVIFLNRYVAAGVAACFAIFLWMGGVFSIELPVSDYNTQRPLSAISDDFANKAQELGENFSDGVNKFFTSFDLKGVFDHEKK